MARQQRSPGEYRLIVNDCGSTLNMDYPISYENAMKAAIYPLVNSYVDCIFWTVHTDLAGPYDAPRMWRDYLDAAPYEYIHKDGRPMGLFMEKTRRHPLGAKGYDYEGERRRYGTSQELWEQGHDMTDIVTRGARRYGISPWLSFRQNDMHHGDSDVHPRFWVEHPEYHLGEGAWGTDAYHGFDRTRVCFNYDYPEVREYMIAPMLAAAKCYDIDGIELDFIRHHYLFKKGAVKPRIVTEYIRKFKTELDKISEEKGVPRTQIAARAMPGYEESVALGLDYIDWAREGLIDYLVVGGLSENPDMPIDKVVLAVKPYGVKVYACHDGLPYHVPERKYHAAPPFAAAMAAKYYQQGATGIYLFNHGIFSAANKADSRPASFEGTFQMGNPDGVRRADKVYSVGWDLRQMDYPRQLPLLLYKTKTGEARGRQTVAMYIADDMDTAIAMRDICKIELQLVVKEEFTDFDGSLIPQVSDKQKVMESLWGPNDEFEITFNGIKIPDGALLPPDQLTGQRMLKIDLLHSGMNLLPKRGDNTITFEITRPDPKMGGNRNVSWERCFMDIRYNHGCGQTR